MLRRLESNPLSKQKPNRPRSLKPTPQPELSTTPPVRKNAVKWPWLLVAAVFVALLVFGGSRYFMAGTPASGGAAEEAVSSSPEALFISGADAGYVEPTACLACHQEVWKTYQHTGMARSFFRPSPEKMVEDFASNNRFYHPASKRYYTMTQREGKYFQRRHELGAGGEVTNVIEKEIHFVMGSGNHARTYLHKTSQGTLVELPVGWYAEKGGHWAMNPGYDRPDHDGFRREIGYDCMFCHNGYPELAKGSDVYGAVPVFPGKIPEGIDCQRCHGPGEDHVRAAQSRKPNLEEIRNAILNPSRLSTERQMELCMQCHLESSSRPLPYAMLRYSRGTFSYRPGEALSDYALHFDHAGGTEDFEIAHAAYRLRKSACFQASAGAMTCLTCHNPHNVEHGDAATARYQAICLNCHGESLAKARTVSRHTANPDCLTCHMPKRRTSDAVHVVMTDHFIQRRKPSGDLSAPRAEDHAPRDAGEVVLYYPPQLPPSTERELYLAVAQVIEGANRRSGIPRLERAVKASDATGGEFYYELAQAHRAEGNLREAIGNYEEALKRKPGFQPALVHLGETLAESGDLRRATEVLERAARNGRPHPPVLAELSAAYLKANRNADAERIARSAIAIDPDLPVANNNLGMALFAQGLYPAAAQAYREAIRVDPRFADAHYNLGNLLAMQRDLTAAIVHYRKAIESAPGVAETHYNLGAALGMNRDFSGAKREFERVLQLKPDYHAAHLNLGNLERVAGNRALAVKHFEKAAASPDPAIRQAALNAIGGG